MNFQKDLYLNLSPLHDVILSANAKIGGGVKKFSNSRKLKIMVGVKVFAMKIIYTERILGGRTFDIRAILPIFRHFTLFQG